LITVSALFRAGLLVALSAAAAAADTAGAPGEAPAVARVEARSSDLLAVGLVRGDRMTIHLSRLIDNAPVRDAALTVVLRGAAHPTVAETDGSYTLQAKELLLPGAAAVEFQVTQEAARDSLKGTLQVAAAAGQPEDKNSARQLWWWVLNFAVCIGFLWLISRRKKAAQS
jgi:cobalt-zinc-cadmium efflux system membrane fusion protein